MNKRQRKKAIFCRNDLKNKWKRWRSVTVPYPFTHVTIKALKVWL